MTLTELRYIVAVAREGHFGRAAETCFVSQPTLSLGVKKIEEELGVTLFERGHHEIVLTAEARQLIEQAERVLEQAERLRQLARRCAEPWEGTLRIGAIVTVGPYLLPDLLPVLHERLPRLSLMIEEQVTAQLTARLKQGELDAILVSTPYQEPGIEIQPVYQEPFVVLLPVAHPLTRKPVIEPDDLANETVLLLGKGNCFRDQVLDIHPQWASVGHGQEAARPQLEGSSLETIRYMVASGLGVSILPCTAAGADRYAHRLVAIRRFAGASVPTRTIALACRKTFARQALLNTVADAVRHCPLSCVRMLGAMDDPARGNLAQDPDEGVWPLAAATAQPRP